MADEHPASENPISQIDQQLRQLAKLREDGLITDEEFNSQKKSILANPNPKTGQGNPAIWNPAALGNWSVLLTPLFGAFLQAKNWDAVGNQTEAKKTMVWFYFGIAIMLLVLVDVRVGLVAYVVLLLSWYFISNRKQQKYVRDHFGNAYPRKGWGRPLAIGLIASIAWQIIVNPNLRPTVFGSPFPSTGQLATQAPILSTLLSASTPPCADEKTVNLVKEIYLQSLEREVASKGQDKSLLDQMSNAVQISITTIRTASHDEKIDKFSCDAVIEVRLPDTVAKDVNTPLFRTVLSTLMSQEVFPPSIKIDANTLKADLNYTSQMTDDKKEHLVELRGHKAMVNTVFALGVGGAFKPQVQAATAPKTLQQEVTAAPAAELKPTESKAAPEVQDVIKTKYGTVEITGKNSDTRMLLIDGQRVKDAQGRPFENDHIDFEGNWELSKYHAIVVSENCAGTACGASNSYHFLILGDFGKKALSAGFGDGSEDATVQNDNGRIVVGFGANGIAVLDNGAIKIAPSLMQK